jgi:iron(III) transport system permease protein
MTSVPILFLLLYPAFRNMDPSLEESAQTCGASRATLLRHVTLPLLAPAILAAAALSTVVGMESFEVEPLLGVPAGIFVFTTRVYKALYGEAHPDFGGASALSIVLLTFTVLLIVLQRRVLARRVYVTVTGKGYRARTVNLGPWRWVALAYVASYLLVFGIVPFAMLLLKSFVQVSGFLDPRLLTTRNWEKALTAPQLLSSIQNTVIVGVCTATVGVVAASLAAYCITRLRWGGRTLMDLMVWLPIAIPGLVLALGFLWAFVGLPIYSTIWILVLAFLIRGLPTSSRFFTSTMVQVGAELEEAARVHGMTWTRVFLHIWRPLLQPALLSAWIYLFVISVRTLDSALLLTGPNSEVLSVSIFQQASRGDDAVASALAMIQIGIIMVAYLATRIVGRTRTTASPVDGPVA